MFFYTLNDYLKISEFLHKRKNIILEETKEKYQTVEKKHTIYMTKYFEKY